MSASPSSAAVIFDDLGAARRACGRGEVVAQLAPLSRWIVVDIVDFNAYALTCGWVMDVSADTFLRPRCIDCDGFVEISRPEEERCGACQVEHEEGPIRLPSASERIARALWGVQDRAFGRMPMTGQEG